MNLDQQIVEAIAYLENLEEDYGQKVVTTADDFRKLFTEELMLEALIEGVKEQIVINDIHLNTHISKYNNIRSFKERKGYFDNILKKRQLGHRLVQKELNAFLENPKLKLLESWVQPQHLQEVKKHGLKKFLVNEFLFGNLQ